MDYQIRFSLLPPSDEEDIILFLERNALKFEKACHDLQYAWLFGASAIWNCGFLQSNLWSDDERVSQLLRELMESLLPYFPEGFRINFQVRRVEKDAFKTGVI